MAKTQEIKEKKMVAGISVIIPCFNAAATIEEGLEALAAQKWDGDWEIIVSNNGSTDGTREVVANFQIRMPNLRLIDSPEVPGAGHARNAGVAAAKYDVLAFVDADDVVDENWLSAIASALEEFDFVASRFDPIRLNDTYSQRTITCPQQEGLQEYRYPRFLPHAGGCGLAIRREIHEKVNGFNESMLRLQDTDYCWRVQLLGIPLNFASNAVVHIRFRNTPGETYRQARVWGMYNVLLYKKYRQHGMPKLSAIEGITAWLRLLRSLPGTRSADFRAHWLWQVSWRFGRIQGSLKHRIIAL